MNDLQKQENPEDILIILNNMENDFNDKTTSDLKFDTEKFYLINLLNKNSTLKKAAKQSPTSLKSALLNCASVGLSLNPNFGLVHLIPRKAMVENKWIETVTLLIGFRGLIYLATREGKVRNIVADVVRSGDEFIPHGKTQLPEHIHNPFEPGRMEKKIIGVYSVASFSDGGLSVEFMGADEVMKIKNHNKPEKDRYKDTQDEVMGIKNHNKPEKYRYKDTQEDNTSPWKKWEGEMYKKTVIRRLIKNLPYSPSLDMAIKAIKQEEEENNEVYFNHVEKPSIKTKLKNLTKKDVESVYTDAPEEDSFLKELKEADRLE